MATRPLTWDCFSAPSNRAPRTWAKKKSRLILGMVPPPELRSMRPIRTYRKVAALPGPARSEGPGEDRAVDQPPAFFDERLLQPATFVACYRRSRRKVSR